MTATVELLMLMQDGTSYTTEQLVEATGMSAKKIRATIYLLTQSCMIESTAVQYKVTKRAIERMPDVRRKAVLTSSKRRAPPEPLSPDSMVAMARDTQPNSVFNMVRRA